MVELVRVCRIGMCLLGGVKFLVVGSVLACCGGWMVCGCF